MGNNVRGSEGERERGRCSTAAPHETRGATIQKVPEHTTVFSSAGNNGKKTRLRVSQLDETSSISNESFLDTTPSPLSCIQKPWDVGALHTAVATLCRAAETPG